MEVRNEAFELLGTCDSVDAASLASLLVIPALPPRVAREVDSIPVGKITRIAL